jgi:hypothetical protein
MKIQAQRDTFAIRIAGGDPFSDFMAYCMSTHLPMDTQSLGRFVQQENLPAQVYRDLSAFMSGMRYMD